MLKVKIEKLAQDVIKKNRKIKRQHKTINQLNAQVRNDVVFDSLLKSSPLPPSSESSTSLSALNITKESKLPSTETNDCKHEAAKPLESNEEVDDLPL